MWQSAQTIFLSIVLESLPFILLGVILSSLIHEFVTEEKMLRFLPKNKPLAVVASTFLGMFVPVCDCGAVPVVRSLMRKGVPASVAMSFTLAAPVLNPITMLSTYVAFGMTASMMWARSGATFGIAVVIGWMLLMMERRRKESEDVSKESPVTLPLTETAAAIEIRTHRSFRKVFGLVTNHTVTEFFEIMGFVVISAFVAAILQTYVPAAVLSPIGEHPVGSVLAMMGLATLLSLCSTADGFVARSLAGLTTNGGLLGFLVIGQIIDIRNILLLPRVFPKSFVVITFVVAFLLTFAFGIWVNTR
ncbi:permease [Effusibacillus lacus]|uniref:Permease n=1 Tax=Effusibacillus lacus TaxID=1348429 RepID=A0A292YI14_9BACL|nr:permease [Effusibacillus lacus]TCS70659.1 hypothetical protein EDD64_13152 [Effusibacillus lacus]GAX90657.1 hypothetical protein [Effusibacillus lacus]